MALAFKVRPPCNPLHVRLKFEQKLFSRGLCKGSPGLAWKVTPCLFICEVQFRRKNVQIYKISNCHAKCLVERNIKHRVTLVVLPKFSFSSEVLLSCFFWSCKNIENVTKSKGKPFSLPKIHFLPWSRQKFDAKFVFCKKCHSVEKNPKVDP